MAVILFRSPSIIPVALLMMMMMVMSRPSDARHEALSSSELVNKVCSQTSNYTFCADALYSHHLTPGAEDYSTLAFVSFNLAYLNSSNTQHYISQLLNATTTATSTSGDHELLERCDGDYKNAIFVIGRAENDMNSDSYDSLFDYATNISRSADDCQSLFGGTSSLLTVLNGYLKGLSEICSVVSKFLHGDY